MQRIKLCDYAHRIVICLGVIFIAAAIANTLMALVNPAGYLNYRQFAVLEFYRLFINGWFAQHTQPMVLWIAAGQLLIGIGMLVSGPFLRPAIIGIVLFGLAIAPLGNGSAFPCSVLLGLAAALLWNSGQRPEQAESTETET